MKSGTKVLGVLTALAIMLAGVVALSYDQNNTDGATPPDSGTGTSSSDPFIFALGVGETVEISTGPVPKGTNPILNSGNIPPGLSLSHVISGTPSFDHGVLVGTVTTPGYYEFSIAGVGAASFQITVAGTIPYNAPTNLTPITGANWYYTPTAMDGVTISIQGAPWLSTAGNAIYGTPITPGSYNVTITLSKAGYQTSTHTFTLSVSSALAPLNSPTNGSIIYAVG